MEMLLLSYIRRMDCLLIIFLKLKILIHPPTCRRQSENSGSRLAEETSRGKARRQTDETGSRFLPRTTGGRKDRQEVPHFPGPPSLRIDKQFRIRSRIYMLFYDLQHSSHVRHCCMTKNTKYQVQVFIVFQNYFGVCLISISSSWASQWNEFLRCF